MVNHVCESLKSPNVSLKIMLEIVVKYIFGYTEMKDFSSPVVLQHKFRNVYLCK